MMRIAAAAALLLLVTATPAFATGGFDCRTTDGSNIALRGTVGRVVGNPLIDAHLQLDERTLATTDREPQIVIVRSWLDAERIWVDLADSQVTEFVAQLRVRMTRSGGVGTLRVNGITRRVRCEVE